MPVGKFDTHVATSLRDEGTYMKAHRLAREEIESHDKRNKGNNANMGKKEGE